MSVQEFRLPSLAESVVEGEVLGWLVAEGDLVTEGQSVLEVMTDKVTVELPSPYTGRVQRLLAEVGQIVAVGGALALIELNPAELARTGSAPTVGAAPRTESPPEAEKPAPSPLPPSPPPGAAEGLKEERSIIEATGAQAEDLSLLETVFAGFRRAASPSAVSARVLAVPSARQLARQQGIPLEEVQGSGPNGAVRQSDVQAHLGRPAGPAGPAKSGPDSVLPPPVALNPVPGWPPPPPPNYRTPAGAELLETRTRFRGTRRAISQALLAGTLHTAQTHTVAELDCSALMALRSELRPSAERGGVKLSYLPFFLKAVAVALHAFPALNSSLDTSSQEVVQKGFVHLGVAVNTDAGLVVPVVRNVPHKSLLSLARETADLGERARLGTLTPLEMQDATFTVSNIGAVGALVGVPLVTPPAVGILSLHSIVKRPVAIEQGGEDVVAIRPMMYLTLAFDHRLVDGADAARFNSLLVELLEQPGKLYLQM
ncbi:dihydrolipoamide acetyltransferase family protein [Deinococcus altitudinis]|uniref:dihydrolipoamide acetyltransferase family protein n=1 Tax=Deinococcus altitudinis TaxID=468914 RepID=UPI0038912117